jgi:hypothetical protein
MSKYTNTPSSVTEVTDRSAERRYWRWMAVHAFAAIPAFIALAPAVYALRAAGVSEPTALALGFVAVTLFLAVGALVAWLQTHHWLGWLFRDVRARALIGAERLARDDDELMLEGIREVVFEWHHIDDLLRERELAAVTLGLATGVVLILLVFLMPWITDGMVYFHILESVPSGWAMGAFVGLALLCSVSGIALSWSVHNSKCFSEGDYDPTIVIQERVSALLTEVKALRRTGVIA